MCITGNVDCTILALVTLVKVRDAFRCFLLSFFLTCVAFSQPTSISGGTRIADLGRGIDFDPARSTCW